MSKEGYLQTKIRECLEKIDGLEQRVKKVELKNQRYEQHGPGELNERINKISKQLEDINIENIKKINKEMADNEFKRNLQKVLKINEGLGDQIFDNVLKIINEYMKHITHNAVAIEILLTCLMDGKKPTEKEFNEFVERGMITERAKKFARVKGTMRYTHIDVDQFIKDMGGEINEKMDKMRLPLSLVEGYTSEEFNAAMWRIRDFLKLQLGKCHATEGKEVDIVNILKEPIWSVYVCPHCQNAKAGMPYMTPTHVSNEKGRHSVPYQEIYKNLTWKDARNRSNVETDVLGIGLPIVNGIDDGPDPQGLVKAFIKILDSMAELKDYLTKIDI